MKNYFVLELKIKNGEAESDFDLQAYEDENNCTLEVMKVQTDGKKLFVIYEKKDVVKKKRPIKVN